MDEDPETIVNQIVAGMSKTPRTVILEREEAIRQALDRAGQDNIVLIAGKGHEDTQIFKDRTVPFDDRQIARRYLGEESHESVDR